MSHFKVAVITYGNKTVEELMAPYQENNCGDVPRRFLEFNDCNEEYRTEYENETLGFVYQGGRLLPKWDKAFKKFKRDSLGIDNAVYEIPDDARIVEVPFKAIYPTFEDYLREWIEASVDEETGRYGYWENPNAKWDYWTELDERGTWLDDYMGGNGLRICDLKFDSDRQRIEEAEWWRQNMEGDGNREVDSLLNYFHTRDMTKEQFIEASGHLWFRAVVTPDGTWHEVGEMGWFGMSSESSDDVYEWAIKFEERFIQPLNPNCEIHVVDCHI